uniref:Uncharacterized protein n=1 Tax=Rhipicephalus zambeziensis TaxID=60191 RepID=A0A224YKM9_9ACAR
MYANWAVQTVDHWPRLDGTSVAPPTSSHLRTSTSCPLSSELREAPQKSATNRRTPAAPLNRRQPCLHLGLPASRELAARRQNNPRRSFPL